MLVLQWLMKLTLLREVDGFIKSLQPTTQSKWLRHLTLLEQYGENLVMPHVRLMGGGIRELRVRGAQEIRAFFIIKADRVIIVHAFIKKTQKTPTNEMQTVQKSIQSLTQI